MIKEGTKKPFIPYSTPPLWHGALLGLVATPSSKVLEKTKYLALYSPGINPQYKHNDIIDFAKKD